MMRTLTEKYLGGSQVAEDRYKIDLAVLDRYQSFTSEVLRLALLGITACGFIIFSVILNTEKLGTGTLFGLIKQNQNFLLGGVMAFALSASTALAHRFYSTDCLTHFVRRLRMSQAIDKATATSGPETELLRKTVASEEESLDKDLKACRWLLVASTSTLALGAALIAISFALILFEAKVP